MSLYTLIPAGIGLLSGGAVGHLGKCSSGTCRLTANPLRGALFGAFLGAALAVAISTPGFGKAASEPHLQIVKEITDEPDYDAALQAVRLLA